MWGEDTCVGDMNNESEPDVVEVADTGVGDCGKKANLMNLM